MLVMMLSLKTRMEGRGGGGGGGHTVSYIITQDIYDEAECGHQNPQHQDEQPVQDVR